MMPAESPKNMLSVTSTVSQTLSSVSDQDSNLTERRLGLRTIATTPPATVTVPTSEQNSYEKSIHKTEISDKDLNMLKEQIRILHGLPLTREKIRKKIKRMQPPKLRPKSTMASRKRAEVQQRRIVERCGNLIKKFEEYNIMMRSSDSSEMYRQMRKDAMSKTEDDIEAEYERQEFEKLKYLADRAKENESQSFKENQGSRLRFMYVRGEPIISKNFRNSFDDFMKPPFMIPRRIKEPKIYNLPKIDKSKEIWLMPFNDEQGMPLHMQKKSPDPNDKRTKKEKARPKVKPGVRTPRTLDEKKKGEKSKRPPWNFDKVFCQSKYSE